MFCAHSMDRVVYEWVLRELADDPLSLLRFCRVDRAALATGRWLRCGHGEQSAYERARHLVRRAETDGIRQFAAAVGPSGWQTRPPWDHRSASPRWTDPCDAETLRAVREFALSGDGPEAWFSDHKAYPRREAQARCVHADDMRPWRDEFVERMPLSHAGERLFAMGDAPDPPVAKALFVLLASMDEQPMEPGPGGLCVAESLLRWARKYLPETGYAAVERLVPVLEPAYGVHVYVLQRCSPFGVRFDLMVGLAPR